MPAKAAGTTTAVRGTHIDIRAPIGLYVVRGQLAL
jgi:hypothetical protein